MSIEIENNSYKYEDEELDDIEYLEILSMDEIIKNNPYFIALSENEIKNELFNIFKSQKKADTYTNLFFEILDNNKEQIGKYNDYSKFIIVSNSSKKDYSDINIIDDALFFNSLAKLNIPRYTDAKNRYFFSIKYDDEATDMRFKPEKNINIELFESKAEEFPKYYPIFPSDDANVPVIASYFKVPYSTPNDYIYMKVISHLFQDKNINYNEATLFTSIDHLLKHTKPTITTLIESLKNLEDDFELDYECLNNHFKKYGNSLDFINGEDFDKIYDCMIELTSNDKERKSVFRNSKSKKPNITNNKMMFFDKFDKTLKLLKLTDSTINTITKLQETLMEYKLNNINDVPILYNNIHDIIININNGSVSLEQVIDNIKSVKKRINIDYSIQTLDNLIKTNEKIEDITIYYEEFRNNFAYSREHMYNIDKSDMLFINFHNELKEIIAGGNDDNYEGVPAILKNNDYENFEDIENEFNDFQEGKLIEEENIEKYWLNLKYREETGFIELLKILLPIISKIQKISAIDIDLSLLSEELFNNFRGISTKYNIIKKYLIEASIIISDNILIDIVRLTPNISINTDINMGDNIKDIVIKSNKDYIQIFNDAFAISIAWICLNIQDKILNNTFITNEDNLNPIYIDKWYAYGIPVNIKEKTGVVPYISSIILDMLIEKNDYLINDSIQRDVIKIIEIKYKTHIETLRTLNENSKKKKKVEQGIIAQKIMIENIQNKKFNRIASDYIDALLYMPGVNYKKIHKFLLGCCLQKIDKDFKADNDLYTNSRKDLIDIKKKFATRKETNKKRYLRFSPLLKDKKIIKKDIVKYLDIKSYSIKLDNSNILKWLNDMYNKNPLLPSNIIDIFKDNSRNVLIYIETYIKNLQTTSRNKNSEFQKYFMKEKIDYKKILLNILKELNQYKDTDDNVINLLKLSRESIRNIIIDLDILNSVINNDIAQDINRINMYICSRALCLPCNPELSTNNYLNCIMPTPQNFIEDNAKKIHNSILNSLKYSTFPTVEEITTFLNTKREENKQIKLNILNNKTVEENQLISNLRKAGIANNLMQPDDDNVDKRESLNDNYVLDVGNNDINDADYEEDDEDAD